MARLWPMSSFWRHFRNELKLKLDKVMVFQRRTNTYWSISSLCRFRNELSLKFAKLTSCPKWTETKVRQRDVDAEMTQKQSLSVWCGSGKGLKLNIVNVMSFSKWSKTKDRQCDVVWTPTKHRKEAKAPCHYKCLTRIQPLESAFSQLQSPLPLQHTTTSVRSVFRLLIA